MMPALRRNTELGLILLGIVITAATYTLASLGTTANLPADIGPFLGVVLALLAGAHVATRRLAPAGDGVLLPLAGLLNGLGYVWIARLNEDLAALQATWTAVGITAFVTTLVVVRRARDLERYRYTFMLIGVALLLMPLLPVIGKEVNGARIWVGLGPVSFQPGEFAKIILAIFFASYLVEKREVLGMAATRIGPLTLPELRHFGPVVLAWGASLVVMTAQRDLGSSLLFFALFVVMLWVATERASYLAVSGVLFAAGAFAAWSVFSHVQQRISVWIDPWADATGQGYQVAQSTFALAWGGVAGTGPGLGTPDRIPLIETDFIFAAIGEEFGLLGATAVLITFMLMIGSGLRIALRAQLPFNKLLASGLTAILGIQSFIIIGGVIRLVPLTGITLPFVSYGGSSLIANYVLLALLIRISDDEAEAEVAGVAGAQPRAVRA
ncbi:MAG: FtsW/RodA/SpoVE family cell cycle protein [Actinobacteria bacterium]|nr:FtsW/RodA/SpoVE family cell cycle protein [Actinomycetota bacterium]